MKVKIVIGKNFGDEGKGLATDYFAMDAVKHGSSAICVRHNGGAQAGHTVELRDKRFVFSQLTSASFRDIATYWADSFMPDLYKLSSEAESFGKLHGKIPDIFASGKCRCTYIGDVLINMLLETKRGKDRHGSCGMGINEAAVRSVGFPLYLGEIKAMSASELYSRLRTIQREYVPVRLEELSIDINEAGEYGEMLNSVRVLYNAAEDMCRNTEYVSIIEQEQLRNYDEIIFEGAQGLLLDEFCTEYAPHLTSSRTGLFEPSRILGNLFSEEEVIDIETVYVTRSYVTRHGAGPLPNESVIAGAMNDKTNVYNQWQGQLRTALHGDIHDFMHAVRGDIEEADICADISLFITHLNESGNCIMTHCGNIPVSQFCDSADIRSFFKRIYLSGSPFAEDTVSQYMK